MAIESGLGPHKFRASVPWIGLVRRAPVVAAIVFANIGHHLAALLAAPAYFILEELRVLRGVGGVAGPAIHCPGTDMYVGLLKRGLFIIMASCAQGPNRFHNQGKFF